MFMEIYCDYCGQTWELYERDDITSDKARSCPHCGSAKIRRDTWIKKVVPAFRAAAEVNTALYEDHADHNALFTVDFIADHIF